MKKKAFYRLKIDEKGSQKHKKVSFIYKNPAKMEIVDKNGKKTTIPNAKLTKCTKINTKIPLKLSKIHQNHQKPIKNPSKTHQKPPKTAEKSQN
jgi:outer membrane lipoprotein-sorting protein